MLNPNYRPDGRILKHIAFKFPVSYDTEDEAIRLINENDVETVVLLRGVKTDRHISVDLDVEKLGIKSEKMIVRC